MSKFLKLFMISLLLTACAPAIKNSVTADYVKTHPASYPEKEYHLQPGDSLDVKFFYNPELNESGIIVRPDGRISLQLAPEIMAAGLTPAQLSDTLKKRYAKELANTEGITVIVRTFSSQRVYVDGEVGKPGMVDLVGQMTVLQSIAVAGGFKDSARTQEVIVIRKTPEKKPFTIVVDLDKTRYGEDRNQDIALMPYDIVYVPKSTIANVNMFVDQYIRKNIPVSFGVTYGIGF
jgi:polysaccharide export outer membrane protein